MPATVLKSEANSSPLVGGPRLLPCEEPTMRQRLDDTIDLSSKPELFGALRTQGIVSVSADRVEDLTVYRRVGGTLQQKKVTGFRPFLWLEGSDLLERTKTPYELQELKGCNDYKYLLSTENWADLKEISDHIADVSGRFAGHPDSPQLFITELSTQYLLATGQTYFNQTAIEEVCSVVLSVYTASDTSQDSGDDPDRIVGIALREGFDGKFHWLCDDDEEKLLWLFRGKIKKLDPDLILGHNLFKRDLELLKNRSKAKKVKQDWGRTETSVSGRDSRMTVAEKQLDYKRWKIPGRELVDSWILAVLHDVSSRELLSYDLADVCAHFGLEVGNDTDSLEQRAFKDTQAIAKLHRNLLYPYFLQAQIFPMTFENVVLRGNATRINHLFLREYYRQGYSIPKKPEVENFAGGLTAQEHEGCAYGVYHCDIASLYPSLIVTFELGPRRDELGIFTGLLETLRDFRILAKSRQRQSTESASRNFFSNLQTTFKILINSFYGYLGFGQGHFGDFDRAAEVTAKGRELLQQMMAWLKERGAAILEVDTDGIYFVPSEQFATPEWVEQLDATLPNGVHVEFDGRYRGMYCHKMKNYALLEDDGSLILRGSGLRSRATEPFLREFTERLIRVALQESPEALPAVLQDYEGRLKANQFSVESLIKTETLIESPSSYAKKTAAGGRNRAAVYELALVAERSYRAGESISYYITGDKATVTAYDNCKRVEDFDPGTPDYNVKYYLKKLKATYKKFAPPLSLPPLRSPLPFESLPEATA